MNTINLILLGVVLFSSVSCDDAAYEVNRNENGSFITQIDALPIEPLNDGEISAIMLMREEEKLARDVYDSLYAKWNSNSFNNISSSEQKHMEAVLTLINKYELSGPSAQDISGEFVNTDLQKLYNNLTETGSLSLIDAFKVGAAIEEIDILDLQRELDTNIDNEDIIFVFENLMKGSRNHLRSFVKNLSKLGIIYTPQYLTKEGYDEIINTDMERGMSEGTRKRNWKN
ncbi:DUF2202 domain-containing protein [Fulvivirga sp. 29W222]|uniref:DUF2202 domain-containing protein n=1 Tax=Fulvivirga marina TaxID=2494733 RepID=A0A937FVS0_9BACT|nr:DUF2202 domain-containing protein [Fulvivirga marina]MBL6445388.1 DUF2202 domain-containing protein [Fulvivirga marina]